MLGQQFSKFLATQGKLVKFLGVEVSGKIHSFLHVLKHILNFRVSHLFILKQSFQTREKKVFGKVTSSLLHPVYNEENQTRR